MLNLSRVIVFLSLFFIVSVAQAANACIDVNTSPQEELEKIKHIGESRAKQIIMLRGEKLFSSIDELDRVIGIGPARVSDIKQEGLACVQAQAPSAEVELQQPIVYPSGIIINEIMPSPEGVDEIEEWIEIFNQNNFEADLSGWQIRDTIGKTNVYTFPAGTKISAQGFLILGRPETKIILNNDSDGLSLIQPDGKILDSVNYEKAPSGQSYSLINSAWSWNKNLTPGAVNRGPASVNNKEKPSFAKATEDKEKGLAAISEPIIIGQDKRNFYPFSAAFGLAIFLGFAILFLKHKTKI